MSGMKQTTLKKLLKNRVEALLATVKDEKLKKMMSDDILISGGAIASALTGEKINDYDIYFRTRETALAVAKYYAADFVARLQKNGGTKAGSIYYTPEVREMKRHNCKGELEDRIIIWMQSAGVAGEDQSAYKYFETQPESSTDEFFSSLDGDDSGDHDSVQASLSGEAVASAIGGGQSEMDAAQELLGIARNKADPYRPILLSENAITLSDKVQLVIRFYGEPDEIHKNYDFAHAMCCYDHKKYNLIVHNDALSSMLAKNLIYRGSLYPIASLFRVRKFLARGWRITAGQMLKIIHQVSKLNLNDRLVLREQLIGVDQAYMSQLLVALENNKTERIDSTYLANLIDTIFE